VILRTCARCASEYEWGVHVSFFGTHAGFSREQIAATRGNAAQHYAWDARDALLIRLVDELHDTATVSDPLWTQLEKIFTAEQLLELIALTGYYHTIAFMTNACRVALEPDAARFE
jgi:4-carboxymuconolactone decarboxylase